jgi:CPA2 family monovalent cation:H+ antiporter-2
MQESLIGLMLVTTVAVLAVALARALGLPSLLAYLAVGVALGPHGLRLVNESEQVAHLAEFGVVFLMFSIGLEFSLARLKSMQFLVFGMGGAQMGLTMLATIAGTIFYYGQDWRVGLTVGAVCAMSSTAIVAKLLSERFELHTAAGRQTMGVLLFQDLAVVPLLILIPALAAPAGDLAMTLGQALLIAVVTLLSVGILGPRVMRHWFDRVSRGRSDELFTLSVLWMVLVLAGITAWAGLSMALGAFLAGVLISETRYRHQVEADVRPFRDVLLGVFFLTIGMRLDLYYVITHLPQTLLALLLLVLAKGGIVFLISLAIRSPLHVALRTAAQLAQAGEFGFVLIELGGQRGLIPEDVFQVTIAAMLLSMFLAPLVINRAGGAVNRLQKGAWANDARVVHAVAAHSMDLKDHVILCGYGRAGQNVARFLDSEQIPYLALDLDAERVRFAEGQQQHVVFGNAERAEVLTAAGLRRARAVIVTYPDAASAELVVQRVRQQRQDIPVVVRATDDSALDRLRHAGATEVVPEVLEGSLMLGVHALAELGVPTERALRHAQTVREGRYARLAPEPADAAAGLGGASGETR